MRCTRIAIGRDRHGGLTLAALFLALMVLTLLAFACQEEAKVLPTPSPASGVAERAGSPEASDIPEATASPSSASEEEARDILERAQERMSALTTYHASWNMRIQQAGSQDLEASYEMDIEQSDRAYAFISSPAMPDFEMVFEGLEAYVRFPGEQWQTSEEAFGLSVDELGFNRANPWADLEVLRLAGRVDMLGDEEVDGVSAYHLRGSISAEEFADVASGTWDASGLLGGALESVEGGMVELDYYIGRSDFLVRQVKMQIATTIMGSEFQGEVAALYSAFNDPVDIPEIE